MTAVYNSYILCTAPRSGSTLLCALLTATGVAGAPKSYFHRPDLGAWERSLNLTPADRADQTTRLTDVLAAAHLAGSAGTGVVGTRLQADSRSFLLSQLAVLFPMTDGDTARIAAAFGKTLFVYLERDDTLMQAISLVKAEQTGLWHRAPDGTEIERLAPDRPPEFDANRIAAKIDYLTAAKSSWANWFDAERINPLRLSYAELSEDSPATVARMLSALGLDPSAAGNLGTPVAKLADDISLEWAERYRAELRQP
ncbi:MAG: sulfotransferase [Rhodobacteraceae bacterium]|nr:sulfotransferase [Paracoccaceae bacterium]